jgi:hypothetical protein
MKKTELAQLLNDDSEQLVRVISKYLQDTFEGLQKENNALDYGQFIEQVKGTCDMEYNCFLDN